MPPFGGLGGGAGNEQEKERERSTWLVEDEDVWGTDPDVTPTVIGLEEFEEAAPSRPDSQVPGDRSRPGTPRRDQSRGGRG
jgi:hypothetical protein